MADKSENLKTGPLIAFVHVPKTAGSFVNACLKAAGLEGQDHIERWLNDPAKASTELPRLDWISGHVPFPRMRELLESSTDRQIRFFTTVRDPLRQIISHYNWLIELYHRGGSFYENHPPRIKEISEKIRESDNSNPREIIRNLKEFSGLFLNQQSRMVLGESNRNINERGIIKILNKYEFISSEMDLRNLINIMTNKNTYIAEEVNKSNYHFDKNVFYEKELAVFLERHHADDLRLYRILNESTRYRGKKTANHGNAHLHAGAGHAPFWHQRVDPRPQPAGM